MRRKMIVGLTAMAFAAALAGPPSAAAGDSGGVKIGFSLSGGLGFINGGDFNTYIRDWNRFVSDENRSWGEEYYTIDWKEMKSMPDFKGEIFARFGRNFGLGLGVETIKKSNPGTIANEYSFASRVDYPTYYIEHAWHENLEMAVDQTLSVIPLTLGLYYFLPLGSQGDVYFNAGAGVYLGTLKSNSGWSARWGSYDEFHLLDGSLYPPHIKSDSQSTQNDYYEATCNAVGFHFGAGAQFSLTDNISIFGEALYRLVNFKDWEGTGGYESTYHRDYGWWTGSEWITHSIVDSEGAEEWAGGLWYSEEYDFTIGTSYSEVDLYKEKPEPTSWRDNIRPAEINLNGFVFRVGIKIFFGL
ncbi:MAG TPA: outer membrane beta-barrel protein [Candidatus Aminicenantes bacterium]|jgi:hypothetical protein|nr:outer membrane beta-barrel protein [Acidobacteriota bacterium]OQB58861.1 MAG: hypothetical protein BWX98_00429 [Candidatus Aminicenantes bacterium ADurb.Bin147]HNQ79971.1 outer membrane beta-barrel protein [Candidatus Aminicenantes bacterium]HNT31650.1 outer membrane beta-barrel protein [Candidatus Aminicenantes bacterium]HOU48711.1 outer membrane beta-barrel protein [Candidatus Aminicenantes bacterium]